MEGFTDQDWELAAGVICPGCRQAVLRIRPADGLCLPCGERGELRAERQEKRRATLTRAIRLHNARVERKAKQKAPA